MAIDYTGVGERKAWEGIPQGRSRAATKPREEVKCPLLGGSMAGTTRGYQV
jgi:hypothetical protein